MNASQKAEALLAWARYLSMAETMRRSHDRTHEAATPSSMTWVGAFGYWAASLYVVAEGWETAGFSDPIIDALLGIPNYKDALRRLRNGVYHYQPELISHKLLGFLRQPQTILWTLTLHEEFCRWLRDWIDKTAATAGITEEQFSDLKETLVWVIGWFPMRPAEESCEELKSLIAEANAMLDPSDNSEAARELRATLNCYDSVKEQTAIGVRNYRRDCLAQLGLNPDQFIPF